MATIQQLAKLFKKSGLIKRQYVRKDFKNVQIGTYTINQITDIKGIFGYIYVFSPDTLTKICNILDKKNISYDIRECKTIIKLLS